MKTKYDFSKAKRGAVIQNKNKSRITIYIDNTVLEAFRDQADQEGRGYQTLINEALRKHLLDTSNQMTKNDIRQIVREELQLANEPDITYTGSSSNLREVFQYYGDNEKKLIN